MVRSSMAKLKLGMERYQSAHARLPPRIETNTIQGLRISWRLLLAREMEKNDSTRVQYYDSIAADPTPTNPALEASTSIPYSPIQATRNRDNWRPRTTEFVALVGGALEDDPRNRHWIRSDSRPENVVLVIEVRNISIFWYQPQDVTVEDISTNYHNEGANQFTIGMEGDYLLFQDLKAFVVRKRIPKEVFLAMLRQSDDAPDRFDLVKEGYLKSY